MKPPWAPDIEVQPALARVLIERQFPELVPVAVSPLGVGWDNSAFLVNGCYVFRFPRRYVVTELIEHETRLLPFISPSLPLPVPLPIFIGRPSETYGFSFAGYRMLPGRVACSANLGDKQRTKLAEPIGRFLACLHSAGVADAAGNGAVTDVMGRLDLPKRIGKARRKLDDLSSRNIVTESRRLQLLRILDAAPAHYQPAASAIVHGDLYARHLLLDRNDQLCGVIDWGDVHLGDPAVDLVIAFSFLPSGARGTFLQAYGRVNQGAWRVARLRALWHTLHLLDYVVSVGDTDLVRDACRSLEYVIQD